MPSTTHVHGAAKSKMRSRTRQLSHTRSSLIICLLAIYMKPRCMWGCEQTNMPSSSYNLAWASVPRYHGPSETSSVTSWNGSTPSLVSSVKHSEEFIYEIQNLLVNLGPKLYSSSAPAYGLNGCISGFMVLSGSQAHVENVSAKVKAYATTIHSPVGSPREVIKHCILNFSIPLYPPPPGGQFQTDERVPLSIPMPIEVPNFRNQDPSGTTGAVTTLTLPPSHYSHLPSITCDISYFLKMKVKKKGLRRTIVMRIPFYYLPKTSPVMEIPHELYVPFPFDVSNSTSVDDRIRMVKIATKTTKPSVPYPNDEIQIFMSFPNSPVASGSSIPISIDISCPISPALVMIVADSISVEMQRNITVWHGRNDRKAIDVHHKRTVSTANRLDQLDDSDNSSKRLKFSVQAGAQGKECSWALEGVVSINYTIHVSSRYDTGLHFQRQLPQITHDESIQITTDAYGVVERQLASTGGVSLPALGLLQSKY